jgi:hypothetical protein
MGDVVPLPVPPISSPARELVPGAPGTVLPMRDRLYKRILEEAWAERLEREREISAHREPRFTPRLRLVRP